MPGIVARAPRNIPKAIGPQLQVYMYVRAAAYTLSTVEDL